MQAAEWLGLAAGSQSTADAFSAAIDSALDPQSPETLDTRLRFADFLAKAEGGDCGIRLEAAQNQVDAARAKPALSIALPAALAHVAGVEYQIHLARADCAADPPLREKELRAALDAARRAVELYRDAFDAASMATMQFNSSVAYHRLGDNPAAVEALLMTIEMDREYGYRDDAEENYRLVLEWNGEESGPDAVAAKMQDFPERSSSLKFAWFDSDAQVSQQSDSARLVGDEIVRGRATVAAQRSVRRRFGHWSVRYQFSSTQYDLQSPPAEAADADGFAIVLTHLLTQLQDFDVQRNGNFGAGTGRDKHAARLRADAAAMIHGLASQSDLAPRLRRRIQDVVEAALQPSFNEGVAAQGYELETGTWIGATLDQGVWYDMSIPLSLPVAPGVVITHKVEFAYTRNVPCTADSATAACVEIVLHAVPNPAVLKSILGGVAHAWHLPHGRELRAWSSTYMRLVADPDTLMPYVRDMRLNSYWPTNQPGRDRWLAVAEKNVFTTAYLTSVTAGTRQGCSLSFARECHSEATGGP